jgi:hypothetical protein
MVGLEPLVDAQRVAMAEEPDARAALDRRLRRSKQARVWILKRGTPGGQFLVQPQTLLVRSPRATDVGLSFARVVEPESLRSNDPAHISWEQVHEVQVRVSNSGRGAMAGLVILGTAFGAVGAGMSDSWMDPPRPHWEGFLMGFLVGGTIGTLLGAVVGSASKRSVTVYP